MRCEGAVALDAVDRDTTGLVSLAARAHVRSCPQCRRELAAQRRLRADLHDLGPRTAPGELRGLADGLFASILAALDAEDRRSARRGALAFAAAGAVSALAVSGAIVAFTQRRRLSR
jgi:hypothetical protein